MIEYEKSFTARVRGVPFTVDTGDLPAVSRVRVYEYGLQRILNDSVASAKSDDEALALAQKRWNNLVAGIARASSPRTGNAVERRAMELALAAVTSNASFLAAIGAAGLKVTSKEAVAKARALAAEQIAIPDNQFTAQAELDVAAAKALTLTDLVIEL